MVAIAWVAGAVKSVSADRMLTTPTFLTPASSITFWAAFRRFWKPSLSALTKYATVLGFRVSASTLDIFTSCGPGRPTMEVT